MSGLGPVRLALRGLRAAPGVSALVALLVLVGVVLAVGGPRATGTVMTTALQQGLNQAGNGRLALDAVLPDDTVYQPDTDSFGVGPIWSGLQERLDEIHGGFADLGDVVGAAAFVGRAVGEGSGGIPGSGTATAASNALFRYTLEAAPGLRGEARLVSGHWPAAVRAGGPLQVVMSARGAATMHWKLGQSQTLDTGPARRAVLVGTVEPRHPGDAFWSLDAHRAEAGAQPSPDGTFITYYSTLWVDDASWPALAPTLSGHLIEAWYPIDVAAITADDAPHIAAHLRRFAVEPSPLDIPRATQALAFRTDLPAELVAFSARAAPSTALIALFALGPAGALAAVLLLGLRLLRLRRSGADALVRGRGGSGWQLRLLAAAEIAVWTVPVAAAGAAVAVLLTPDGGAWTGALVPAALCALAAPVAAAAFASPSDGAVPSAALRAARLAAEGAVVLVAVLALVLVATRGPVVAVDGADPLVEAAPLLLALAVTVVVLRIAPVGIRWLGALLRRARGAVGLVAASGTGPAWRGGAWALFALVVGVGMSVFSLTMVATQQHGSQQAALSRTGGDVAINSTRITGAQLRAIEAIPGVAAHATIGVLPPQLVGSTPSAVYVADPAALASVQRAIDHPALGEAHGRDAVVGGVDDPPATVTISDPDHVTLRLHPVESDEVSVVLTEPRWVLVDRASLPKAAPDAVTVGVLLRLAPGADRGAVVAAAREAAGPNASVRAAATDVGSPLDSAVRITILGATVLAALLCLGVFVVTLAAGAAERLRRGAILRALGFDRRQTAGLVLADLAPTAVIGIVAGALTGVALAAIVLPTIDPAGFVGSSEPPPLVIDPPATALALLGFVVAALAAAAVAVMLDLRRPATAGLQTLGEER
jgi:putative ABC transport system permease protein